MVRTLPHKKKLMLLDFGFIATLKFKKIQTIFRRLKSPRKRKTLGIFCCYCCCDTYTEFALGCALFGPLHTRFRFSTGNFAKCIDPNLFSIHNLTGVRNCLHLYKSGQISVFLFRFCFIR